MTPSMDEMFKQMAEEIRSYPDKHPEMHCSDCGVVVPFQPTQFTWDDRSKSWKLIHVNYELEGWGSYTVRGKIIGYKDVCGACAKKRGIA